MQMAYSELGLAEMLQSGALFVLCRVRRNTNNIPQPSSRNVVVKIVDIPPPIWHLKMGFLVAAHDLGLAMDLLSCFTQNC